MAGSANRRRRQSDGAHQAAESRSASKQQTNPARTTQIRFRKISAFPDSFLTPRRSQRNEGRTEDLIGIRAGTDKSRLRQDYLRQYQRMLSGFVDTPITIIEIGLHRGAS